LASSEIDFGAPDSFKHWQGTSTADQRTSSRASTRSIADKAAGAMAREFRSASPCMRFGRIDP